MTRILLAGATGLVGSGALALLLGDARISQVVAPTRSSLPSHPKLLNPIMDSFDLPADAEWWRVDGAICAIGTTRAKAGSAAAFRAIDYGYALAIAARVRENGAARFALTSSIGADPRSRFLYTRTKGEIEQAVSRLEFPSLTIVRPGFLGGKREENRPMEQLIAAILGGLAPVLPAQARISPASIVAAMLVEAAIEGPPGNHWISAADIALAASGNRT